MVSAAEAPLMPIDIRVILSVGGKHEGNDLSLATETFRESGRTGRSICRLVRISRSLGGLRA